jgi:phage virion morphogenesis protein
MIEVKVESAGIQAALRFVQGRVQNMQPLLADIGDAILANTQLRFKDQKDPQGIPWKPLAESTLRRRRKRGRDAKILRDTGQLYLSLTRNATSKRVEVGTNKKYGKYHQQETPGKGKIPRRAFLGLTQADRAEIHQIMVDYMAKAVL